jgi:hypothetical protein
MSEVLNEKEDLSESKTPDLNTYFEDEINKIIHDDESIDDESPEVGSTTLSLSDVFQERLWCDFMVDLPRDFQTKVN